MSNIIWIIVIGFIAGLIARFVSPGPNGPSGFILTTVLGVAGAFVATFIGQTGRLVSARSRRGSDWRHRRRTGRIVHLEQACGPPCYQRSGRVERLRCETAGPQAVVNRTQAPVFKQYHGESIVSAAYHH